jgi:hypothetical protein
VSVYHFYHCHCSSVLPHCVGDDVSFTHPHTERTFLEVYSVFWCTPALYSRFRWWWSGNCRFLLCNISTLKLFTCLSVVLPLFVVYFRVVLPFSLVVVWQLPLLALHYIHTQTVHASVGCTPVVRCVLPRCTPVFVGGGLATVAPCFATYPHSGCSGFCGLYSRCWLTAWFKVSVYHFYHCHCSSVLPPCVGDGVSFTHTHTERTLLEVYNDLCCTPVFVCDGMACLCNAEFSKGGALKHYTRQLRGLDLHIVRQWVV